MIKKTLLIFTFLIILALPLFAEQAYIIDKNEDACINKSISTADMLKCTATANEAWDKDMNKYYNLLMKKLPADQKSELLKTQKSWLTFRDNDAVFTNSSIREKQGTMYLNVASGARRETVKQRALQLKSYYQIIFE